MAGTIRIHRDGKDWDYTPGKNSTYIAVQKDPPLPASYFQPVAAPAKVISSPLSTDPPGAWSVLSKRKAKTIVAPEFDQQMKKWGLDYKPPTGAPPPVSSTRG